MVHSPLRRAFGCPQHLRHLRDAQAAGKPQFDHSGLTPIEFREFFQGIFNRQQIGVAMRLDDQVVVQCDAMLIATPLGCPVSAHMIHKKNLPHGVSGSSQKMGPALPINAQLTDELQVGFVNQRGRLKRMALSFPCKYFAAIARSSV